MTVKFKLVILFLQILHRREQRQQSSQRDRVQLQHHQLRLGAAGAPTSTLLYIESL